MEQSNFNKIFDLITDNHKSVISEISDIKQSINTLNVSEAAREEREKQQDERNGLMNEFMERYRPSLNRMIRFQDRFDKISVTVIASIFLSVLYYFFKG